MKIDLTTKNAALNYLRSLDAAAKIELPGAYESKPNSAEESPNAWEWTASELAAAVVMGRTVTVTEEGMEAEVVKIHADGDLYVRFEDGEEGSYSLNELEL